MRESVESKDSKYIHFSLTPNNHHVSSRCQLLPGMLEIYYLVSLLTSLFATFIVITAAKVIVFKIKITKNYIKYFILSKNHSIPNMKFKVKRVRSTYSSF